MFWQECKGARRAGLGRAAFSSRARRRARELLVLPSRGGVGTGEGTDQDHGRRIGWFRAGGYLQARSLASVTADAETVRQWPGQETRGSPAFPDLSKLTVVAWWVGVLRAGDGRQPSPMQGEGDRPRVGLPACLPTCLGLYFV